MAFEDFLRSIPLVHKHIMRTRRLILENMKFRKFLERNGLSVEDILSEKTTRLNLNTTTSEASDSETELTLHTLVESLRAEQIRAASLEADLYVLQIDYDDIIKSLDSNIQTTKSAKCPDRS